MATAAAKYTFICDPKPKIRSRGVFYGDNPFLFATPCLMAQISVASLLISLLQFLLTPLGQSTFVPQSIGGIILGAPFIGEASSLSHMFFSTRSSYVNETVALFGCMLFLFVVGVKTDLRMVRKSGRKAVAVGLSAFFVPLLLNHTLAWALVHYGQYYQRDPILHNTLLTLAGLQSLSSNHVITCLLADLKLLNSKLGRFASSSSLISGTCSWFWLLIAFTANQKSRGGGVYGGYLLKPLCVAGILLFIVCVLRPIIMWIIKQTGGSDRKGIKEGYIVGVFVMVLGCSFFGEIVGQHFLFGPMILGLVVPDGPPLGSALVDKLETYVSSILLPIYFAVSCTRMDMMAIRLYNFGILELTALIGLAGKLVGTMLPSLYYCKMPLNDAFSLGLIMSAQGVIDIQILRRAMQLHLVDDQSYTIMVISMVLTMGITSPILKMLYRPSTRRYKNKCRQTVQHARPNEELRLIACIYHQNTTPWIINLLKLSNPTTRNPICLYPLHLVELSGRSSSLQVEHQPAASVLAGEKKPRAASPHWNQSDQIIKALRLYQQQNEDGAVIVNPFTVISPYATMHQDVCEIALNKRVSLVIVPVHQDRVRQQYCPQKLDQADAPNKAFRAVNRNVLRKAPCSVGVLLDRARSDHPQPVQAARYRVGVIFVGGPDDREALSYAVRMGGNRNVTVTVVHLVEAEKDVTQNLGVQDKLDIHVIHECRQRLRLLNKDEVEEEEKPAGRTSPCWKHHYRMETMEDSVAIIKALRSLGDCGYDMILVGRRHPTHSPLLLGLTGSNDYAELGIIGSLLASPDTIPNGKVSILALQQQTLAGEDMPESPTHRMKGPFAVVDIPSWPSTKVWPVS